MPGILIDRPITSTHLSVGERYPKYSNLCAILYQEVPNIQVNMYFVKPNIFSPKKRSKENGRVRSIAKRRRNNVLVPPNY